MSESTSRKRRSKKKRVEEANKDWGFEYLLNGFLKKVDETESSTRTTYGVMLIAASVVLLVIAALLEYVVFANFHINTTVTGLVQAIIAFPAAIAIFAFFMALFHLRREEGAETAREKKSYAQRRRLSIFMGMALLVFIFLIGSYLPYAVGGTIVVTGILFIYNYLRRTNDEIVMHQAGLMDPRDLTEEELEIAAAIEDGTIQLDEDFFLDEDEEEEIVNKGDNR